MKFYSISGYKPKDRNQENQDVVICGPNFVVLCDGHGPNPGGRDISETVAACCAELIPPNMEVSPQSCAQLCQDFKDMICTIFENLSKRFPNSGTTVLIVVFSPDGQTYMIVKLGDSYVLEIPEGFSGDGRPLAFDSVQLEKQDPEEETEWGTSMSPWQVFMKHRSEPGRGKGGSNAFWSYYGARIFMQGHFFIRDGFRLRTMGIEPTLVKPDDDIRRVLESFTVCGIFQRKAGHRLVIASDGLPIHKPEIWSALSSDAALRTYFAEKTGHDDVTVVII
jgi:serine/threonine protein phosphatase PrpC